MQPEDQDRVVIVLVRARNPSNIGAVARAMHDLGYSRLRIVNEYPVPFSAAKSAVDASAVLHAATEHADVASAIADCTLVIGTTAVGERALEHPLSTLDQAALTVRTTLRAQPSATIALLFGSEKTGLSNAELAHCHALLTIPMSQREGQRYLSMNLGQAAAVCLYAIRQAEETSPPGVPVASPATAADLERLSHLLLENLNSSGYTRRHPANSRPEVVRRLVRRMGLSATDATVWFGIMRQFQHAIKEGDDGLAGESK